MTDAERIARKNFRAAVTAAEVALFDALYAIEGLSDAEVEDIVQAEIEAFASDEIA